MYGKLILHREQNAQSKTIFLTILSDTVAQTLLDKKLSFQRKIKAVVFINVRFSIIIEDVLPKNNTSRLRKFASFCRRNKFEFNFIPPLKLCLCGTNISTWKADSKAASGWWRKRLSHLERRERAMRMLSEKGFNGLITVAGSKRAIQSLGWRSKHNFMCVV